MSITVPIRRPRGGQPFQRPQPKPEFALMAAAQMAKEGKFGESMQPADSSAALQSMQPQQPVV